MKKKTTFLLLLAIMIGCLAGCKASVTSEDSTLSCGGTITLYSNGTFSVTDCPYGNISSENGRWSESNGVYYFSDNSNKSFSAVGQKSGSTMYYEISY